MSKKILIIDDVAGIRRTAERCIQQMGYNCISASNGAEGLKAFSENHIDLVLTDVMMPEKDGCEVVMELKRKSPNTPIICMSGGSIQVPVEEVLKIVKQHANHVLEKPFSAEELKTLIEQFLA